MKIISINVGLPQEVPWGKRTTFTSIYKSPVEGSVEVLTENLEGDKQADLSVHGGPNKAIYVYPAEHYSYWQASLNVQKLDWGNFGENFTSEGLLEEYVNIGDIFQVGTAQVRVTEPRMPCYKLGIRFGRIDMVKRFLASKRPGFYLAVIKKGKVQAGDIFTLVERNKEDISVADISCLYAFEKDDWETLRRVVKLKALSESWRNIFQQRLEKYELSLK